MILDAWNRHKAAHVEMAKWIHLPYWQARSHVDEASSRFQHAFTRIDVVLCGGLVTIVNDEMHFPDVWAQAVRLDRRFAALRTVEAIRDHAATSGGRMPATLNDLRTLPVPLDPMTGQPFDLRVEHNQATVRAADPTDASLSLAYVLTLSVAEQHDDAALE